MFRLRLGFLALLAVVAAACTTATEATTTTVGEVAPTETGDTTVEGETTTTTTAPSPAYLRPDLSDLEGLSADTRALLEDLVVTAQQIRELPFLAEPLITVVSDEELSARVLGLLEEQLDDLPADTALYRLLGMLEDDQDLENLLLDLYDEQVAGFYDSETGEVVVPGRSDGFTVLQQGTLIHELVHALTDQHFGFSDALDRMIEEDRFDEGSAYRALIEGDAVLAEVLWVQGLSPREVGEFVAEAMAVDDEALSAAPLFIRETLLFPYERGLGFVQQLYSAGGWEAVNEAYREMPDLPGSTEQIFTPGVYGRDLPTEVDIPVVSIDGYTLETTSVWGELGFRVMLGHVLGESAASSAARGWGGDAYHQWFDGENAAFLLVFEADTEDHLEGLRGALVDYTAVAIDAFASVEVRGDRLYFIAAHEPEVGEHIRSEVGLGTNG